ncbi:hypothetical protein [Bacteroides sedimenti]|uniref:DUF3592 domain-containing protein n=1 Tax=Bacteroides sedimenti TaxID=2136147 RepID=A0ABM8IJA2_9BACE
MKKNNWSFKNKIIWFIILCIIVNSLVVIIRKTIENNYLIDEGVEISAVVTDVRYVGSKGKVKCTYTFKIKESSYTGSVDNDYYMIGDTIKILYSKKDPNTNRDKKFLEQIYKW